MLVLHEIDFLAKYSFEMTYFLGTRVLFKVPMTRKLLWFHWKDLLRRPYNPFYSFFISVVVYEIWRLV